MYVYTTFFYPFIHQRTFKLYILAIVNNNAVNVEVQIALQVISVLLDQYPGVG